MNTPAVTTGVIVNIDFPDIKAALRFYEDGLGFQSWRMLFDGAVAELSAGATLVYLIEHASGTNAVVKPDIARNYTPHWTPVHLDVVVKDIESAIAKALAAGATRAGELSIREWGKVAPLRDPFGHAVCLLQFLGDGYDLVAD